MPPAASEAAAGGAVASAGICIALLLAACKVEGQKLGTEAEDQGPKELEEEVKSMKKWGGPAAGRWEAGWRVGPPAAGVDPAICVEATLATTSTHARPPTPAQAGPAPCRHPPCTDEAPKRYYVPSSREQQGAAAICRVRGRTCAAVERSRERRVYLQAKGARMRRVKLQGAPCVRDGADAQQSRREEVVAMGEQRQGGEGVTNAGRWSG